MLCFCLALFVVKLKTFELGVKQPPQICGDVVPVWFQLSEKLLSMNLANQSACDGVMISALLDVDNPASLQALEQDLCSMDWPALLREINENPAQEHLNKAVSCGGATPCRALLGEGFEVFHCYTYG